ncbi:MAG TPA: hypothetical protein VLB29_18460 [Nocardioidaceae bacterium]|nr:hypothetical protein [Nocardioidaceae bacterium]
MTDDSPAAATESGTEEAAKPMTAVGHTLTGCGLIAVSGLLRTSDFNGEPVVFLLVLVCGALGLAALLTAAIATGVKLGLKG